MDLPYLLYYCILIFLSYLYWKSNNIKVVSWTFIITFVFFAFRAPVVGADTWDYVRYLTGERNFYNYDPRPLEPLFLIYRNTLCTLTNSRLVVMIINTIVTTIPLYYMIRKYSYNPPLSILFFCFWGGLMVYFVGLRQILALSVLYVALIYWLETKDKYLRKTLLLGSSIFIAYFFHTSTVLYSFIIVICLLPLKLTRITYILVILCSAFGGLFLKQVTSLDLFSFVLSMELSSIERLDNYLENTQLNDTMQLTVLLRLTIVSIVLFAIVEKEKLAHPFCKIFLLSVVLFNFLYSVPMIERITNPLYFFGAIALTWIMGNNYKTNSVLRLRVNIFLLLLVLYYMRSEIINLSNYDLNHEARMHPYYFIFEDYSNHPSIKKF